MTANPRNTPRPLNFRVVGLTAVLACAALLSSCGMGKAVTDFVDSKDSGVRKRAAVAPFASAVKEFQPQAEALRKSMVETLGHSGGPILVDIAVVQDEMGKVGGEARNPEERALIAGRRLGLTAIVTGSLVDVSIQYRLKGIYGLRDMTPFLGLEAEMKVLNPGSGTVAGQGSFRREEKVDDILAENIKNGSAPPPNLVEKLMAEVTKDCQGFLVTTIGSEPWVGTVLEVQGDRVLINVGNDSGLSVGSQLNVFAVAERLRTVGGQEITVPGAAQGRVRLVEMGQRSSWAVAVEGAEKKGAFEPGQTVRTR